MRRIKITKLNELPDARHPNNIAEGFTLEGELLELPTVGKRFYVGPNFSTSGVQEILPDNTFRTFSSIYKWELLPEQEA